MDNPRHEHNTKAEPFQDPLCSSLDHEELFSAHMEDELAEQWMSPESNMLQNPQPEIPKEPFELLLEEPRQSILLNGQIAQKATGILSLYSMLWETYNTKIAESQRLEKENKALHDTNIDLLEQRRVLERRHADQVALIAYYGQIFDKVRRGIAGVLRNWEGSPADAAWEEELSFSESAQ